MHPTQYLTVQLLTKYIKKKFDVDPYLSNVYVKGEISNFKQHSSGHMYFTLKDQHARILAVMFSSANKKVKFKPENGMNVLVKGALSVYESSGQYQIYVKEMEPDGIGALYVAYEQLKEKLEQAGYFSSVHKKTLPPYPSTIGVITSPTGAAVRDIITTIKRRYPIGKILIYPVHVQGEQARGSITKAIQQANKENRADVLIVGRGGGSIEELWAFNEEIVADAIYQSIIPVVSAVGHETDFTISDFVADVRAATPTGAAELVTPNVEELFARILQFQTRILRATRVQLQNKKERLMFIQRSRVLQQPQRMYEQQWEKLDHLTERLQKAQQLQLKQVENKLDSLKKSLLVHHPARLLERSKQRYARTERALKLQMTKTLQQKQQHFVSTLHTLEALSPLRVMDRGYNLTYNKDNKVLKSVENIKMHDEITLQMVDGKVKANVSHIERSKENE